MRTNLERAQDFALDQWLSDYPEDMTYQQVLDLLNKDEWNEPDSSWDDVITPWQLVEDHTGEQIASFIVDTCAAVQRLLSV